ncbi:DnaJ-domain-containing protein [Heliocybe sulcata]|uniref:DnaJ-domain-containing protein n=1 Tax=Heliocybe sulcata TaxID=5364 RepID=A0A5C3NGE3_9AGAM|nr:DnaJ-domain-containing protein [Heliocybe sulcata]
MRLLALALTLLALLSVALAWTKEDHEIFDLTAQIEAAEGKDTNFYSWLEVPSTASIAEINKAYRKKSLQLHPDKNPGVKGIQERFARLGVVAAILRSSEGRERYDFFYKNGFPRWKGTGYYYARFRPGLITVLGFLIVLTSGLQYVAQRITYKRDLERVQRFIREARTAAWGPKLTPLEGPRKVRVNMGPPRMDDEGNVISGRALDMVVDGPHVFILEPDGNRILLDTSAATPPALKRTWFISLVNSLIRRVTAKSSEPEGAAQADEAAEGEASGSESTSTGYVSEGAMKNGKPTAATATTMAGGRRRKAVRKR